MSLRMQPHPDQHYLDAIRHDESAAIQRLIAECYPPVRGWVLRNGGGPQDAQDIFNDAMTAVCKKLRSGEDIILSARFSTFLFRICQNHWYKKLRRKKFAASGVRTDGSAVLSLEAEDADWLAATEEEERQQFCREKLAALGEACRRLLLIVWSDDPPTMHEVAAQMGYESANAASQRKYQCIEKLKQLARSDPRFGEL